MKIILKKKILSQFILFLFILLGVAKYLFKSDDNQNKTLSQVRITKQRIEIEEIKQITENKISVEEIINFQDKEVFKFFDVSGYGEDTTCENGLKLERVIHKNKADFIVLLDYVPPKNDLKSGIKRLVFSMESEVHRTTGDSWHNADFRMWYNLDQSYPEPATYFDVKMHLRDLLSPPKVEFNIKEKDAPIVWVVSNCNAYNSREIFIKKLMEQIKVHSYGGCLNNKNSHPSEHMKGNVGLFSKYNNS
jgi:hypothetical protein